MQSSPLKSCFHAGHNAQFFQLVDKNISDHFKDEDDCLVANNQPPWFLTEIGNHDKMYILHRQCKQRNNRMKKIKTQIISLHFHLLNQQETNLFHFMN